jgi:hypothetical protein
MLRTDTMADTLDVRFHTIFDEEFAQVPDHLGRYWHVISSNKIDERFSSIGAYGEIPEFTGSLSYNDVFQGYDNIITPLEWGAGIQIQRRLFDTDQHNKIDGKPRALSASLFRLRQTHAVRPFNNAFSVDSRFNNHSEGVALCSNSHTTTTGAGTGSGFDNLVTTALSATAVAAARIQFRGFRGDQAEIIENVPDGLVFPTDLYETAYEIVGSQGKVDQATNNANVHFGQYEALEEIRLSDTNDWFMVSTQFMRSPRGLVWVDANKGEMAFVEDYDTLVGKWRIYAVWGLGHIDWRWCLGAQVS